MVLNHKAKVSTQPFRNGKSFLFQELWIEEFGLITRSAVAEEQILWPAMHQLIIEVLPPEAIESKPAMPHHRESGRGDPRPRLPGWR